MTIDEAIKRLTRVVEVDPDAWEKPDDDAVKLGIEALKRVKDNPIVPTFHLRALLPGETKD